MWFPVYAHVSLSANTYLGDTAEDLGIGRLLKASSSLELGGRGGARWVRLVVKSHRRLKERRIVQDNEMYINVSTDTTSWTTVIHCIYC